MNKSNINIYHILGLSSLAKVEELERAYYQIIHSTDSKKEPLRYKIINFVYITVADPASKADYDITQSQRSSQDLVGILREAEAAINDLNMNEAIELLKQILVMAPKANPARNELGFCYILSGKYEDARREYSLLVREKPDIPAYWINSGINFQMHAASLAEKDPERRKLLETARACFQKAIELGNFIPEPYLRISNTYLLQGDSENALLWLEKWIEFNDCNDYKDYVALLKIAQIHMFLGDMKKFEETLKRIEAVSPENDHSANYIGGRLSGVAGDFFGKGGYEWALRVYRLAGSLVKTDEKLLKFCEKMIYGSESMIHKALLDKDPQVPDIFKKRTSLYLSDFTGVNTADREQDLKALEKTLLDLSPADVCEAIDIIRNKHRQMYNLDKAFIDDSFKLAEKYRDTGKFKKGPCFVVTALAGSPISSRVDRFRCFRDRYLSTNAPGRAFIIFYYNYGHILASLIQKNPVLRRTARSFLGIMEKFIP